MPHNALSKVQNDTKSVMESDDDDDILKNTNEQGSNRM